MGTAITLFANANKPNLLDEVAIDQQVHLDWFDILSNFANTMRYKTGNTSKLITISDDIGYMRASGTLAVCALVGKDKLELQIPREKWSWKRGIADRPGYADN